MLSWKSLTIFGASSAFCACSSSPSSTANAPAAAVSSISIDDLLTIVNSWNKPDVVTAVRGLSPVALFEGTLAHLDNSAFVIGSQPFTGLLDLATKNRASVLSYWSQFPTMGDFWEATDSAPKADLTAVDLTSAVNELHDEMGGEALGLLGVCMSTNCNSEAKAAKAEVKALKQIDSRVMSGLFVGNGVTTVHTAAGQPVRINFNDFNKLAQGVTTVQQFTNNVSALAMMREAEGIPEPTPVARTLRTGGTAGGDCSSNFNDNLTMTINMMDAGGGCF